MEGPAPAAGLLRVGTWNMSHWSAAKVAFLASSEMVDILAIQETHLAPLPLERAHATARQAGLHLHHGRPAVPMPHSEHGRSCGVGFLCRQGLSVMPAVPGCPAWRRLAAMRRLHGVRLAPREGLPHGLLLLSIYAPLREQEEARACFDSAFWSWCTHSICKCPLCSWAIPMARPVPPGTTNPVQEPNVLHAPFWRNCWALAPPG